MKLKVFKKEVRKNVFSTAEAQLVAFKENPKQINLQLHQWGGKGELIRLKKGVYMFPTEKPDVTQIARALCQPCYFSLEYVLSLHGILPEAVFTYTLVTPNTTKRFETPVGDFVYQKIKREAFTGFDPETLMADKEKALTDYFYLHTSTLKPNNDFWNESRLEAISTQIDFDKVFKYARLFDSKKLNFLLHSFQKYAKTHQSH